MSRRLMELFLTLFFVVGFVVAQNKELGDKYFEKGEFAKAYIYYDKDYNPQRTRTDLLQKMVECKQQLRDYKTAEALIREYIGRFSNPIAEVWLGYNYQLQGNTSKPKVHYEKAIERMTKNLGYAYSLGKEFENKALFEYALKTYNKATKLSPNLNLDYVIGRVYGQLMQYEKMFGHYLSYLKRNPNSKRELYYLLDQFLKEDSANENNIELRSQLLKRSQTEPAIIWNETLAWLFLKEKQYRKTFIQYRAIFNRSQSQVTLREMQNLIATSREESDNDTAMSICDYIIAKASRDAQIQAHIEKLDIEIQQGTPLDELDKRYVELIESYGYNPYTISIMEAYARFLAYHKSDMKRADKFMQKAIGFASPRGKSKLKVALADMLVYHGKYNRASLYYTQVEKSMKNDALGQEALFKEAQVSFFRGDFEWAESQLDALKSASSQFIANDAMQLKWLIKDNLVDSLQGPLRMYAKAELLSVRNKASEAVKVLDTIIDKYPYAPVRDEALFRQARLLEQEKSYDQAAKNYQIIIDKYSDEILIDDALFHLAKLSEEHLDNTNAAKKWYEKIILEQPDSIFYVEARKRFRKLRGDTIESF